MYKVKINNPLMGVPMSFLYHPDMDHFEVCGITSSVKELAFGRNKEYVNAVQHNPDGTVQNGSKANTQADVTAENLSDFYYTADNTDFPIKGLYVRLMIRKIAKEEHDV